jgi:hypothetical protein
VDITKPSTQITDKGGLSIDLQKQELPSFP